MNIFTPIDCYTGYGITGYNIWKNLYSLDNDTTLFVINGGNIEQSWDRDLLMSSLIKQRNYNKDLPCLKIWSAHDLLIRPLGNSKYGALTFFETDTLTVEEKQGYDFLDVIFMPTEWGKKVLLENKVDKPIVVCNPGIDHSLFSDQVPQDKDKDKYVFVNFGKWEIRKGHDILLEIFNKAFNEKDNVELWMINYNPFLNEEQNKEWYEKYKNSKLGDKIKIYPRLPSQSSLRNLLSYTDCGIFPSRGEGWNNCAAELMAMNKPLIITNCSAHTEYCTEKNSYLINIDENEPAIDNMWFFGNANWAKLGSNQIDQGVEHMRSVYKNNIRSNPNGVSTMSTFTWDKTAKILHDTMYS